MAVLVYKRIHEAPAGCHLEPKRIEVHHHSITGTSGSSALPFPPEQGRPLTRQQRGARGQPGSGAAPAEASAGCNGFRGAPLMRRRCLSRALRRRGAPRPAHRRPQVLSGPAHAAVLPEQGPCAAAAHLTLLVVAHILLHLGCASAVVDVQARQLVRERDADDLADHRDLRAGGPASARAPGAGRAAGACERGSKAATHVPELRAVDGVGLVHGCADRLRRCRRGSSCSAVTPGRQE